MHFLLKQEVGTGHIEGLILFFYSHKKTIYITAVDHDWLRASLWIKSRCVKLQYENDLKVKLPRSDDSGIPHRCSEIISSALYLGSHFSTDFFLRFGQPFLGQFGSSVTVCDEGLQVLRGLRKDTTISHSWAVYTHTQHNVDDWKRFILTSSSKKNSCCLDAIS